MSDLIILDVGHGNCTVINDGGVTAVIDAPTGSALLDTLDQMGVKHVEHAFISHADADHIQGILALLTSTRSTVGHLHVNPDRGRESVAWRDLIHAVAVAKRSGTFRPIPTLTAETAPIRAGGITLQVVSPSAALALSATGGTSPQGRRNNANSLSAVIKVERFPKVGVLLAGDLDVVALKDIQDSGTDIAASALVYPHHGGLPGASKVGDFARGLLSLVQPSQVYISNGRTKHGNPREEVVSAIMDHGCGLACTQLAHSCGAPATTSHLEDLPASGRLDRHSCAGSISLTLTETGAVRDASAQVAFQSHLSSNVTSPMCSRTRH